MKYIIKYQKFHDLIQNWLNGRGGSIKKTIFKRDYFKKQLLNLGFEGLDISFSENELISLLYQLFGKQFENIPKKKIKIGKKDLLKFGLSKTRNNIKFLRPVFELQEYIRKNFSEDEIFGFYIHGSISTEDYVENYSDLDTLVIVRKEVFNDANRLKDFRRRLIKSSTFLYLLDPLQHHGHFIITEYDMANYDQFIFPLKLFGYSTALTDFQNTLEFEVMNSIAALNNLIEHKLNTYQVRFPWMIEKKQFNSYQAKNAVQSILTLPFLYAEIRDRKYYYKRQVFDLVKADFLPEQWTLVENASRVRQKCKFKSFYPYWLRKFMGLKVGTSYLNILNRKFDADITKHIWQIMGSNFLRDAVKFADQIKYNLTKQNMDKSYAYNTLRNDTKQII